jgi:hypothetical protein
VTRSSTRAAAAFAASVVMVLAVSACTAAGPTVRPTVIYKFITPSPGLDTPTPSETSTDTPLPTDTSIATPSPTASGSTSPTLSPSPSPTSPGGACVGSASTQTWFAAESKKLTKFVVYCGGHLPSGWHFASASDTWGAHQTLTATYSGKSGAKIVIKEGAFCLVGGSACSPHDTALGSANFGDRSGGLYTLGPGAGYAIYVNAGTAQGYTATGTSVSQTVFTQIVAALVQVPKS